jgi:hypothetical protein
MLTAEYTLMAPVMLRLKCPRHSHSQFSRLRSFAHTRPPVPSSAYLDRIKVPDISTSSTPDDLSPSQRGLLEAALRVDQAGEVAANYIYEGQLAVLRHDPATSALIQASTHYFSFHVVPTFYAIPGYVGPREKAPRCHE